MKKIIFILLLIMIIFLINCPTNIIKEEKEDTDEIKFLTQDVISGTYDYIYYTSGWKFRRLIFNEDYMIILHGNCDSDGSSKFTVSGGKDKYIEINYDEMIFIGKTVAIYMYLIGWDTDNFISNTNYPFLVKINSMNDTEISASLYDYDSDDWGTSYIYKKVD